MTETRRSAVSPVPPPPDPALSYDEAQVTVRKAICRGCGSEWRVPRHVEAESYLCGACRGQ